MADNQKIREEVQSLTDRLESGVQELYYSDKYIAYLNTLAKFHNYSTRNTMLIHMQMPDATRVAGFNKWKNDFNRYVSKGQKGIRILAPAPVVVKKEMEKIDPDTQVPLLDQDGNAIVEEVNITIPLFRPVSVFDVSQTHGEPLPTLAENLTGDVQQYKAFLESLKEVSAMPIGFADLDEETDGTCSLDSREITIRNGMSEVQTISAVVHEMTHAELHDYNQRLDEQEQAISHDTSLLGNSEVPASPKRNRRAEEVETESVSYVVCQHYGIETGTNSFGYIAEWSKGQELPELQASLDLIRKTAASMIERIDSRFTEICKDRGIDLSAEIQKAESQAEQEMPVPEQPKSDAHPAPPKRAYYITPRQREQAERMAEKWEARSEAFYDGGDGWGVDTAGFCKNEDEADKAVQTAANIRISINNLLNGNGAWSDVEVIRQAVLARDELDAQVTAMQDDRAAEAKPIPGAIPKPEATQSKNTIPHRNFRALKELAGGVIDGKYDYMRFQAGEGFMPLTIEHLDDNRFSLMHHYMQNGDLMRDPDMEFVVDYDAETVNATYFRQDPLIEQEVLPGQENGRVQRGLNSFLSQWTKNIHAQEYLPELAHYTVRTKDRDHRVFFAPDGKEFHMGIGTLGNGLTVWNRLEEKNGDYVTIAHIDSDRTAAFREENLPDAVIAEIERTARESDFSQFPKAEVIETTEPAIGESAPENDKKEHSPYPSRYTEIQIKGFEIAKRYEKLSMQDRLNMIAATFGCKTASLTSSLCTGKWRGTSDISIALDNGTSLFAGNYRTPQAKTARVRNECVTNLLAQYNSEIVQEKIALATAALAKREAEDNAVAAEKGLKPYTFLTVELNNGADELSNGCSGWYYVTLNVDDKIIAHVETGLHYDIERGVVNEHTSNRNYFIAGALEEKDVDFVFNNVAFSTQKGLYQFPIADNVRERAERKLVDLSQDATTHSENNDKMPLNEEHVPTANTPDELVNDMLMPDDHIGLSERDLYGYSYASMLPLLQGRALELFDQDHSVYLLYPDNTESVAFDREEIENHDGIFGIEEDEWERTSEYAQLRSALEDSRESKETELTNDDTFAIYQLKAGDELRYHRFASLKQLETDGLTVDKENYDLVYTASLQSTDTLDSLYERFNNDRPMDFTGHSLSVSDVVVMKRQGESDSHYVDNFGFEALPDFLNEKLPTEQAFSKHPESDIPSPPMQPTVAELEEQVKAGKETSLLSQTRAIKTEQTLSEIIPVRPPLYRKSFKHALAAGELEQYYADIDLNLDCQRAIDSIISNRQIDPKSFQMKGAAKYVVELYGLERVELIMAKTVQDSKNGDHYSEQNRAWAGNFEIPKSMIGLSCDTQPYLLNNFLDKLRAKPSVLEALHSKAGNMRHQSEPKQDHKKSKEMEH